jgi:hypothetical protein
LGENYISVISRADDTLMLREIPLENIPEKRKPTRTVNLISVVDFSIDVSSYIKYINVFAYVNRFIKNCREMKPKISKINPGDSDSVTLSVEERNFAFISSVKVSQSVYYSTEIEALKNNSPVEKRSSLSALNVFIDNEGLLRVSGRLEHSNYSYDTKHPIVIASKCRFLSLYVGHIHNQFFHASKTFVCNQVRAKFWVIGGLERLVKSIIYKCVRCTRIKARTAQQIMGNLPSYRANVSRPFTYVGVDYAGYFRIKCTGHRSTKVNKVYAAFFVCFPTTAVHIEIVEELSTRAFLNAFERFTSRRGMPIKMFSDNASNFVGAKAILAVKEALDWELSPPRAPHFGGLWEAAVKSEKSYLEKAVGDQVLTREEFVTVFAKIEAILNARPLCAYRAGDQFEPLTPFHLLIGSAYADRPRGDDIQVSAFARYYSFFLDEMATFLPSTAAAA